MKRKQPKLLKRHELWRMQYRDKRYMEYISKEELEDRFRDIMNNMLTLSDEGKISLHSINEAGISWMIKWTHILEEYNLRDLHVFPHGSTVPTVNPTYPDIPASKKAIDSLGGIKKGSIYKFGKYEFLSKTFKNGIIRIAPASAYSDPSLNKAIKDDELNFSVFDRAQDYIITAPNGEQIDTYGKVEFKISSPTNYYVSCFAASYTFREFDDFDADCCIVIHNPRVMFRKLMKSVKFVEPSLRGFVTPVKYLDPLVSRSEDVNILFAKHFRYAYQNEVRAIWLPIEHTMKLDPIFVNVGPLREIASLIRLNKS